MAEDHMRVARISLTENDKARSTLSEEHTVPSAYDTAAFSGRAGSVQNFLRVALASIPESETTRIVDIGCGAGDLAIAIAKARPLAIVHGLDISVTNIAAAERAADVMFPDAGNRPTFQVADYMASSQPPAHVLLTESVLHLIPGDTIALARKLAGDTLPGGLLIATAPVDVPLNRLRIMSRRLWRWMPRALDRAALSIARMVHANEPVAVLADRIGYLRVVPHRMIDTRFDAAMARFGLDRIEQHPWPSPSLFKLRHVLVMYRRNSKMLNGD